jgi:hypothetical protein
MRLPRVRFTVRRMMVVVIVSALPLAGWGEIMRHQARYNHLASYHDSFSPR